MRFGVSGMLMQIFAYCEMAGVHSVDLTNKKKTSNSSRDEEINLVPTDGSATSSGVRVLSFGRCKPS